MQTMNIEQIALLYLSRGWSVIPIKPRTKRPLMQWEPFQHRLPREEEVREWFSRWPNGGVGIVTGAVSGLAVIDVDVGHGGNETLAELERRNGSLPLTVEAVTGGGGRHIYFLHPGIAMPSRVGWAPGIDMRADGGLVVAPPSLHPSGRRYEWEVSHHPDRVGLAPMPPWLLQELAAEATQRGHPARYWRELIRRGVREGERNSTIASLTGHLLWRDVDQLAILELLLCWNRVRCQPPLPDAEVVATVESVTRTHRRHAPQI
jgi:hypothetical protein